MARCVQWSRATCARLLKDECHIKARLANGCVLCPGAHRSFAPRVSRGARGNLWTAHYRPHPYLAFMHATTPHALSTHSSHALHSHHITCTYYITSHALHSQVEVAERPGLEGEGLHLRKPTHTHTHTHTHTRRWPAQPQRPRQRSWGRGACAPARRNTQSSR